MDQFEQLDFYELLGVSRSASADEIKRAYRQQMARYHPDRFAGASPGEQAAASRRAQRINEAYQVLGDFAARNAYNRTLAGGTASTRPPIPAPPPAGPPRDHLAELYDQARAHLDAGRNVQAVATLRELQSLNPFYRDSAALLAKAEAAGRQATPRSTPVASERGPDQSRRALLLGGLGGLLLVGGGAVAWAFRGANSSTAGVSTAGPAAGGALVEPATVPPAATGGASPQPTATAPVAPSPSAAPSAAPTATVAPTLPPTATLPPASPTLEVLAEEGTLLYDENFASRSGWPTIDGGSWSVGFAEGGYLIAARQGTGNIWAFNTSPAGEDGQIAVDVQVAGGLAGLMLRYTQGSYLAYMVDPQAGAFRLEQWLGGGITTLLDERHPAVSSGDAGVNRLLARMEGERLSLRLNGTPVADLVVASPPPTARYGMLAVASADEVRARFSNLAIRTIG